jgi:hypothetical protein
VILLWGLPDERPLAMVADAVHAARADVLVVDQFKVATTRIELSVGLGVEGVLGLDGRTVELSEVDAAYHRAYESTRLPDVEQAGSGSALQAHAIGIEVLLSTWLQITPALVVNRPDAMASNNSKPYQASLIRELGFAVPATLLTTDPEAARQFWQAHGDVVYKSISGVRSIVSRLGDEHAGRLANIASCPTQFQAHVPGVDVRVHVVADDVFACEVEADTVDYRYARQARLRAVTLPHEIAERCHAVTRALGLLVAGLDLRRGDDDAWTCFEVNPSPGFNWFADVTGQPIAEAIAALLLRGRGG